MTLGKFIQVTYKNSPIFINIDHIVRVTKLENQQAVITLDSKETIFAHETYGDVIAKIENITCYYVGED